MSADILARLEDFYAHRSLAHHADAWSEEIAVAWPALLRVLRAAVAYEEWQRPGREVSVDWVQEATDIEAELIAAVAELRGGGRTGAQP